MKRKKLEVVWTCLLCGPCYEEERLHINSHKHKTNEKRIEDCVNGEPLRAPSQERRWG